MKNMSPSKGISRGQIGKLEEMLGHGVNKSTVFQNSLTSTIDRFIKTVGPSWRDSCLELLEKQFQDFIGIFYIPVNYDEPDAVARAIESAKFELKYVGLPPAEIPICGTGQVTREVHEVYFGRVMYNRDLPGALMKKGQELGHENGFKFADPLTALRLACDHPDEQRRYPLVILFTDTGGLLWCLYLHGLDGDRRLRVNREHPDGYWYELVRSLAVSE